MTRKKLKKRRRSVPSATTIKLDQIENSLLNLESSLQQALDKLDALEHLSHDIEAIKLNTSKKKREKRNIFSRLKGGRNMERDSISESKRTKTRRASEEPNDELNAVSSILQNPKVKSLLENSGSGTDLSSLLTKVDLSKIGKLLQPAEMPKKPVIVQPKLAAPPTKKKNVIEPEPKNNDLGLDLGSIMELMQNPMIQSMIKKVL